MSDTLLQRLRNHLAIMSPEQRQRYAGKLLIEATAALEQQAKLKTGDGFRAGWTAAIEAALLALPGGSSCDPQEVADDLRALEPVWHNRVTGDWGTVSCPECGETWRTINASHET